MLLFHSHKEWRERQRSAGRDGLGRVSSVTRGLHYHLDAVATRLLSEREAVMGWTQEAADLANMTILGMLAYDLQANVSQVPGVSAESHITVHTFPETGQVAMDCYSCKSYDVGLIRGSFVRTFGVTDILGEWTLHRIGLD